MAKKDKIRIFFDEIFSKRPLRNYPTDKIIYNHTDKIWSIDLADMVDYKTSNNKGSRYIFVIIDKLSKYLWAIPLRNKYSRLIINEVSNIITTSKQKTLKTESDTGSDFYNNIFQKSLKTKNIQHDSRFTDKSPSIAELDIRTIPDLSKKPVFLAGNADWISELPSVIKQYNITIHSSIKMTPNQTFTKVNEKEVYSNL